MPPRGVSDIHERIFKILRHSPRDYEVYIRYTTRTWHVIFREAIRSIVVAWQLYEYA